MFVFKRIWALLLSLFALLIPLSEKQAQSTPTAELVYEKLYVLNEALSMGQGITNDGKYYYTSGAVADVLSYTVIAKIDMTTMERVAVKPYALPLELTKRGNNHIGGISCYNGKIYASVEDDAFLYPCIAVFDAETLNFERYYDLPVENHPDGVPWCAVDAETGILYTGAWNTNNTLQLYNADTMEYISSLTLSSEVNRVQGAEIYNAVLYLSADVEREGNIKHVYKTELNTGNTEVCFTRDLGKSGEEAEGITVHADGGTLTFTVIDYNKNIGVYLRSYSLL